MELLNAAQDWMNGDDGEKRRQEEVRRLRMERAREDRLRGLAMSSGGGYAGFDPGALASQHFGQLGGAINAVNSAIDNEMDSRVAQAREARRIAHEQELMRLRMQVERERTQAEIQKTEALLRRLDSQGDSHPPRVISSIRTDSNGRLIFG